MKFEEFNKEIQEKIKENLKIYQSCTVYEDGEIINGILLQEKSQKKVGEFKPQDFFTEVEIQENYINEFGEYPYNYKGIKDYNLMKKISEKSLNFSDNTITKNIGKIIEGNFVIVGKTTKKI